LAPKFDIEARLMKVQPLLRPPAQGCSQVAQPDAGAWYGDYEEFVNERRAGR
jgi:hypothetical protein